MEEHTPECCTALTLAAENGHAAIIRALAAAQADVARTSGTEPNAHNGATLVPPMSWAVVGMHLGAVEALLALRADVDARDSHGHTALIWATAIGCGAVSGALLAARGAVDAATTKTMSNGSPAGVTALMMAAAFSHATVVTLLLDRGADIEAKQKVCLLL